MNGMHVSVRDDSGARTLSLNEKEFIRSCALSTNSLRIDGRKENEIRSVRLRLGRWDNGAECTVQWGIGTRVTSLCSASLVPPSPDRPNEGVINFTVDLSPMASTSFRQAPPLSTAPTFGSTARGPNFSDNSQRLRSNRILRCIERVIIAGGALDTEALVLEPGKWVWRFTIALTVLDDGGNITDACILAAMAALRHYRKPHVDLSATKAVLGESDKPVLPTIIPSSSKEATPLPLHHTPLSISFALISAHDVVSSSSASAMLTALVDPTDREEMVQLGSLTIAMNMHSEVCLLDFGGGCEVPPAKLKSCWKIAEACVKDLCNLLEKTLAEADSLAGIERLGRLQKLSSDESEEDILSSPIENPSIFYEETKKTGSISETINRDEIQSAETEAEEAYRARALDYSSGHLASKVREDDPVKVNTERKGSLLVSMLRSVKKNPESRIEIEVSEGKSSDALASSPAILKTPTNSVRKHDLSKEDRRIDSLNVEQPDSSSPNPESGMEDEEEAVTLLSEFGSSQVKESTSTSNKSTENLQADVKDLSMAIKKKKKKKKK